MSEDTYYRDHWVKIAPEKLERYEKMFQWSTAYEALLDMADIEPGQTAADSGREPGAMLVEMAKRVGPGGQVHGLDVNACQGEALDTASALPLTENHD